jgi:hypothetical protein
MTHDPSDYDTSDMTQDELDDYSRASNGEDEGYDFDDFDMGHYGYLYMEE